MSEALHSCFGENFVVCREVGFDVGSCQKKLKKSLDFIIWSKKPAPAYKGRVIAIELKTTMEFNSLSAAVMELAMLLGKDHVELSPRKNDSFIVTSSNVKCLTVSCFDNQIVEAMLPHMASLLWPNKSVPVTHHCLFLPRTIVGDCKGIGLFINDVVDWLGPISDQPLKLAKLL